MTVLPIRTGIALTSIIFLSTGAKDRSRESGPRRASHRHESETEINLLGRHQNEDISVRARFVVDATAARIFTPRSCCRITASRFSCHAGAIHSFQCRWTFRRTDIRPRIGAAAYPVDDAAVHHIFDGGWIWVLKFNNGITSAGLPPRRNSLLA